MKAKDTSLPTGASLTRAPVVTPADVRLMHAIQVTTDAVISTDSGQRIQLFNKGAENIFGYVADELRDRNINILIPKRFRSVHSNHMTQFAVAPEVSRPMADRREIVGLRKDGEEFPAEASISKCEIDGDFMFMVILRDITARAQTDKEMACALKDAQATSRTKQDFFAMMSHELRTPLNAIIGFSELLESELFGKLGHTNYREYAHHIYLSGKHLLELVNDILDISKIEAGKRVLDIEKIDIRGLVHGVVKRMSYQAQEKQVRLRTWIAADHPLMWVDERAVRQILQNLLSNAIKFTPPGGRVTVRSACDKRGYVRITVSDTGVGIPKESIESVMTPYTQLKNAVCGESEGTGLGLPIVNALVQLHGGKLTIESETGKGTKVIVEFPKRCVV